LPRMPSAKKPIHKTATKINKVTKTLPDYSF